MKKNILSVILACSLLALPGGAFALGEKTLVLGGEQGWSALEKRRGIVEAPGYRPRSVLILDSGAGAEDPGLDLSLGFDEGSPGQFADRAGRYRVQASPDVSRAGGPHARAGTGAALFSSFREPGGPENLNAPQEPLIIDPAGGDALLSGGRRLGDFTLEFWLNPVSLETGGQILYWSAVRAAPGGTHESQWIQCVSFRDRLRWTFHNFFADPGDGRRLGASFSGLSVLSPGVWSRHQVRFDAGTGMLEYLVDGRTESILYLTSTGGEGGEVHAPIIGQGSRLVLGGRYTGLMDEFRLYGSAGAASGGRLRKYPPEGGWTETGWLDLGEPGSRVLSLDAKGGLLRAAPGGFRRERVVAEDGAGGRFSFPDSSAVRFFVRGSGLPWPEGEPDWIPVVPGAAVDLRGRYVQVGLGFYPSGDGENTPWLEEISLLCLVNGPPRPPSRVAALARDGAVELSWNDSVDRDVEGYLVYYGTGAGEYFGGGSGVAVPSPINAGRRRSLRIGGLTNGVLYYFAVSAYDSAGAVHGGEFSGEVSARPVRMIE